VIYCAFGDSYRILLRQGSGGRVGRYSNVVYRAIVARKKAAVEK
jgi:hypothetical protein